MTQRHRANRLLLSLGLALTGTAASAESVCGLFEAVEPGDTFATISERCGVSEDILRAANPGVDAAAPEVATALALALPRNDEIAGEPASPGPRVAPAPAAGADAATRVAVVATGPAPAVGDIDGRVLRPVLGQRVPPGGVCAIEYTVLTAEAYVLETVCGGNGVVVARDFTLRPLDGLTLGYATGGQEGVRKRCVPD